MLPSPPSTRPTRTCPPPEVASSCVFSLSTFAQDPLEGRKGARGIEECVAGVTGAVIMPTPREAPSEDSPSFPVTRVLPFSWSCCCCWWFSSLTVRAAIVFGGVFLTETKWEAQGTAYLFHVALPQFLPSQCFELLLLLPWMQS